MAESHHPNYGKIYATLLILLAISVAGPFVGIKWVTLIAAFGIAIIKANMVIQNFMHLKWERRIAKFVLTASLALLGVFYFGVAPDIMRHRGEHWVNDGAIAATARGIPRPDSMHLGEEEGPEGTEPPHVPPPEGAAAPAGGAAAAAAAFSPQQAFANNCTPCHGTGGQGNGVVAASLNPKPANFTDARFWTGRTDAELVKAIRDGGAAVGRSASMPAWSSLLTEQQATEMVAYLKTLRN